MWKLSEGRGGINIKILIFYHFIRYMAEFVIIYVWDKLAVLGLLSELLI